MVHGRRVGAPPHGPISKIRLHATAPPARFGGFTVACQTVDMHQASRIFLRRSRDYTPLISTLRSLGSQDRELRRRTTGKLIVSDTDHRRTRHTNAVNGAEGMATRAEINGLAMPCESETPTITFTNSNKAVQNPTILPINTSFLSGILPRNVRR
jgi:hypothetical protein